MKIFIELKKHFAFLGIGPDGKSNFILKHFIIISLFTYCCIGMSTFLFSKSKKPMVDIGNSFYGAACTALNTYTLVCNIRNRNKIFELCTRFEEMIKKRSFRLGIYEEVNVKIEKRTKIVYIALVPVTVLSVFVPNIFASYWFYYTTDLGSDAFKQTFTMSMPFDWKTPIGYAITMSIQFGAWVFLATSCCCVLLFLAAVCWMLVAMIEDIAIDFHSLKEAKDNRSQLKTKLNEIFQFHSTAKQFVYDFTEIYEIIITSYYLWSLSTICTSLFLIHVETSKGTAEPIGLLFASFTMFWAFTCFFIFCDLGENMSNQFSEVDNMVYYSNWYAFPKELQRILPIVMISAQQPLNLTGFGNLSCTRETLKKVTNGGFSYFMAIRKMYH